jgi:hypothetical protein
MTPVTATAVLVLLLTTGSGAPAAPTPTRVATPAPAGVVTELASLVEQARQRFVARDAGGVLAHLAESYRSGGLTKAGVRQQLLALYSLYDALRARVQVERVDVVDGDAWIYTTGEIAGYLPLVGWVSVFAWEREPEVARRQGDVWRLVGFQD